MRVLVTGASGFIATHIITDLLAAQHSVTCCARDMDYVKNIFPNTHVIACDFIHDVNSAVWVERLHSVDIVINCVGILYHPNKKIIWAIHYDTPRALFDACVIAGVKKIIHISALGVDQCDVDYANSKKAADDYLLTLPIQSIILRPSLVYGQGSYGGMSLFRGLAALPWFIPVPGEGQQQFQPIHLHDLSKSIIVLMSASLEKSQIFNAVGPVRISLCELLRQLRAWLGFTKAKFLFIPLGLIRLGALFGDKIPYSSMNTSAYKMLMLNNVSNDEAAKLFYNHIHFTPCDFITGVHSLPSTVQDRWHAKLYLLKPILHISIVFIWLWSALCSIGLFPTSASYDLLRQIGIHAHWQSIIILYGASGLNAFLGLALLFHYHFKRIIVLQLIVIIVYSILITWKLPGLWIEPFGPIAKNVPLFVSTLILLVLESDR